MSFIEQIKQRAKQEIKTIVLPEATDTRILEAAQIIKEEGYAKVILIGNEEEVRKLANEKNVDLGETEIIDPSKSKEVAELMEITSFDLLEKGVIEKIIPEPKGGAEKDVVSVANNIKKELVEELNILLNMNIDELLNARYARFRKFGKLEIS